MKLSTLGQQMDRGILGPFWFVIFRMMLSVPVYRRNSKMLKMLLNFYFYPVIKRIPF